ncbi:MAG: aldehyde dehydrogenase family protein [Pseudomonadota bacterium]|nr:aldehyde dehydrogenase family protein [Pseudomonadota bacterium]
MMSIVKKSQACQVNWRKLPAPKRGRLILAWGRVIENAQNELAALITRESKKVITESMGEIQEIIDMCEFAMGLSRQLYGLTMPSEREHHRLQELWHPLGVVGCITAFNFPMAVLAWNFCLAAMGGNTLVWKPSPKTEGCATRLKQLWDAVAIEYKDVLLISYGGADKALDLADDPNVKLLSATGSCEMGKSVAPRVAKRLGRCLLELGGNNASIICPSADLSFAVKALTFAAVGTTGQRCTTLRRLFVHDTIYETFIEQLKLQYQKLRIGDPSEPSTQIGPLISQESGKKMQQVLKYCRSLGLVVHGGVPLALDDHDYYVTPALVEVDKPIDIMSEETFAPILYVMRYHELSDAIAMQNNVKQGLSSSIFTNDHSEAELFISTEGSDCGLANINIGPSGAEIGGAFGGEKETGGGRESGSDAWKSYMRRSTVTVNYGKRLTLSQGIRFDEK